MTWTFIERTLFVLFLVCALTHSVPAVADLDPGLIGVSFDEAGTLWCAPLGVGGIFDAYVVAYDLPEIFGYEFQLFIDGAVPGANLAPTLYGPAPQNFGDTTFNEIRAGTGGCVRSASEMGDSSNSWTLTKFSMIFFRPATDVRFCVGPTPSGGPVPQFAICDEDATIYPFIPAWGVGNSWEPPGCAVASPTYSPFDCIVIASPESSWGTLKSQYR